MSIEVVSDQVRVAGSKISRVAVVAVGLVWSLQHSFMPLTFDGRFMVYRLLAPIPFSILQALLYLRLRRVVPFAVAHALMDGATVLIPLLKVP